MKTLNDGRVFLFVLIAIVFVIGAASCVSTNSAEERGSYQGNSDRDGAEIQIEKNSTLTNDEFLNMIHQNRL